MGHCMNEESARKFINYEIQETLLHSPEGTLYRAVDKSSSSTVLIKKYYPSLNWSEPVLLEFLTRVDYLRFIEHPFLLPILDFGKAEGLPYIIYADDSLSLLSARPGGQPSQEETLQFFYQMAEGLDFLHKQEIIHGTLNVDTICLDLAGSPRIFDYGLSTIFKRVLQENMDDGFQNLCVTNPACTSPEQLLGITPSPSSDLYAYGIVSYYYLFGELPFKQQNPHTLYSFQPRTAVTQAIRLPSTISGSTIDFIQKCIQVDPEDRFLSVSQALKALDQMMAGRRPHLHFEKRIVVTRPQSPSQTAGLYIGGTVLLISLVVSLYLFLPRPVPLAPSQTETPAPAASQKATLASPVETTVPTLEKPRATENNTSGSVQIFAEYKPAIEKETPILPSQPISISNLGSLREVSRLGVGRPEELTASPDNAYFAMATSIGVFIYRSNDNLLETWIDPGGWATSLQFSLDGRTLAVGLVSGDIQLWDWKAGARTATLTGHKYRINRILYSKIDRMYSASSDGKIIIWDVNTNQSIGPAIEAHSRPVTDIAVTSDGRIIISCSDDGYIRVWNMAAGKKLYELKFPDSGSKPKAIALTPDDAYFAVGGDSGRIYQWNLIDSPSLNNPHPELRTDPILVKKRIWSLQYIRNGAELLAGLDEGKTQRNDSTRMTYSGIGHSFEIPAPDKDLVDIFGPGFEFSSSAAMIGQNIVTSNWDGTLTNQQTQLADSMYDNLDRLDISKGGTILAAGGRRDTTHVWDLTTNQPTSKNDFILPYGNPISPDGSSIVIIMPKEIKKSRKTGNIITEYFYQRRQIARMETIYDLTEAIPDGEVDYARDGTILIAGDLERSATWDLASGYVTLSEGHGIKGCRVTYSKNDPTETLQVFSPAGSFAEWNEPVASNLCQLAFRFRGALSAFSDSLELFTYSKSRLVLEAYRIPDNKAIWEYTHDKEITAVSVSSDGKIVALGDESGMMVLIDGGNGSVGKKIKGNFGAIRAIEFSEDGRLVVTAGDDGSVRVFGITG
jgi:WD40 repeat protein